MLTDATPSSMIRASIGMNTGTILSGKDGKLYISKDRPFYSLEVDDFVTCVTEVISK